MATLAQHNNYFFQKQSSAHVVKATLLSLILVSVPSYSAAVSDANAVSAQPFTASAGTQNSLFDGPQQLPHGSPNEPLLNKTAQMKQAEIVRPNVSDAISDVTKWTLWGSLAAGAGAAFAAWLTRRTKISEFRQAWINELRNDIADYVGHAELWMQSWAKLEGDLLPAKRKKIQDKSERISNEARVILYRIQLRVNPRPNKFDTADTTFLENLSGLLDAKKLRSGEVASSWHILASQVILQGRELLKREWEVTKGDLIKSLNDFDGKN